MNINIKLKKLIEGYVRKCFILCFLGLVFLSCNNPQQVETRSYVITAEEILGNPDYQAICYGGYRTNTRNIQPTKQEIKEDLRILSAMNIKVIRTYNVHFEHAENVLKAIKELSDEDPNFEMYVMLGAWIDCKDAGVSKPIHGEESERNATEIATAVELANAYPEIVKIIAVGNEAMVKWATSYFVEPGIILKWVNHLQNLKAKGGLDDRIWVTSSDNFASWGGGDPGYHVPDMIALAKAVDYISIHTYPMHDSHYNPLFWRTPQEQAGLDKLQQIDSAMHRALVYAQSQFMAVSQFLAKQGIDKDVHIGETGWASVSNRLYGPSGSKACDEYKQGLYHSYMREWTNREGISCFFFEAFDESWKDAGNTGGSENHFGLFEIDGSAKYALWKMVDKGVFEGLSRNGESIDKTFDGEFDSLMQTVLTPPLAD